MPSSLRKPSYRRTPDSACLRMRITQGSPTTSSDRAIGQVRSDQSDRNGMPPAPFHARTDLLEESNAAYRDAFAGVLSTACPTDRCFADGGPMSSERREGVVTVPGPRRILGLHPAVAVATVSFIALLGAAGFRAAPSVLMIPLEAEFGWSRGLLSVAVGVNLVLFGLTAPFAAALMDRFGLRRVVSCALILVAAGSGLTVLVHQPWQLILCWGFLVGLGTGSMALVFAATVANRWFVKRRGLVMGVLTAAGATGQLVFLPLMAWLAEQYGWRSASLVVSVAALAVVPLVLIFVRNYPADLGVRAYGAEDEPVPTAQQVAAEPRPGPLAGGGGGEADRIHV